jgi:hypothetical protein
LKVYGVGGDLPSTSIRNFDEKLSVRFFLNSNNANSEAYF